MLWLATRNGYVRADAVTAVGAFKGRRGSGWRLTVTVGGGCEGTWDPEHGGDVWPAQVDLASGRGDPEEVDELPEVLARALARHRDAVGAIVLVPGAATTAGRGGIAIELVDWSGDDDG